MNYVPWIDEFTQFWYLPYTFSCWLHYIWCNLSWGSGLNKGGCCSVVITVELFLDVFPCWTVSYNPKEAIWPTGRQILLQAKSTAFAVYKCHKAQKDLIRGVVNWNCILEEATWPQWMCVSWKIYYAVSWLLWWPPRWHSCVVHSIFNYCFWQAGLPHPKKNVRHFLDIVQNNNQVEALCP